MDVTEGFGRETEPEVTSTPQRVELQWYHANLVFKDGENVVRYLASLVGKHRLDANPW